MSFSSSSSEALWAVDECAVLDVFSGSITPPSLPVLSNLSYALDLPDGENFVEAVHGNKYAWLVPIKYTWTDDIEYTEEGHLAQVTWDPDTETYFVALLSVPSIWASSVGDLTYNFKAPYASVNTYQCGDAGENTFPCQNDFDEGSGMRTIAVNSESCSSTASEPCPPSSMAYPPGMCPETIIWIINEHGVCVPICPSDSSSLSLSASSASSVSSSDSLSSESLSDVSESDSCGSLPCKDGLTIPCCYDVYVFGECCADCSDLYDLFIQFSSHALDRIEKTGPPVEGVCVSSTSSASDGQSPASVESHAEWTIPVRFYYWDGDSEEFVDGQVTVIQVGWTTFGGSSIGGWWYVEAASIPAAPAAAYGISTDYFDPPLWIGTGQCPAKITTNFPLSHAVEYTRVEATCYASLSESDSSSSSLSYPSDSESDSSSSSLSYPSDSLYLNPSESTACCAEDCLVLDNALTKNILVWQDCTFDEAGDNTGVVVTTCLKMTDRTTQRNGGIVIDYRIDDSPVQEDYWIVYLDAADNLIRFGHVLGATLFSVYSIAPTNALNLIDWFELKVRVIRLDLNQIKLEAIVNNIDDNTWPEFITSTIVANNEFGTGHHGLGTVNAITKFRGFRIDAI